MISTLVIIPTDPRLRLGAQRHSVDAIGALPQNAFMHIRPATTTDAEQIGRIYFHTIRTVNQKDYTQAQVEAWAPEASASPEGWRLKQQNRWTAVAEENGVILGFGELEPTGHIDCFYVHHDHQRRGVGRQLLLAIEEEAGRRELSRLFLEASITAHPFFTAMGYSTVRQQQVTIRGQQLTNFVMEKNPPNVS
ncbi:MAG: GNAT family N-acetyltransferase [Planctomycetota bacterium]|nr:GNAT family N-acetyltransferase [Planctomycetota bacterium]